MKLNTAELASGRMVAGSSALRKEGTEFYSYATQIAYINFHEGVGALYVNPIKYSRTTSKQMTWLKRYYQKQGFHIVNWETGEVIG
jgi:hypothetical protein